MQDVSEQNESSMSGGGFRRVERENERKSNVFPFFLVIMWRVSEKSERKE